MNNNPLPGGRGQQAKSVRFHRFCTFLFEHIADAKDDQPYRDQIYGDSHTVSHQHNDQYGRHKQQANPVTRFVGPLTVSRKGDWLTLDFPAWQTEKVETPPALLFETLGITQAKEVRVARDYMVVLDNQQQVEAVTPDIAAMIPLNKMVCITAPGDEHDFVSRFFCPGESVPEDPVTGSTHSMLIPYWADKLGKTVLQARQLSARGGELRCEARGERVLIGGQATTYLIGKVYLRG